MIRRWAIDVIGNWRLTFKFEHGDAYILDCEDYRLWQECLIRLIRVQS